MAAGEEGGAAERAPGSEHLSLELGDSELCGLPSAPLSDPPVRSYSMLMRRIYDERQRETARLLTVLQRGAVFIKYHASGNKGGLGNGGAVGYAHPSLRGGGGSSSPSSLLSSSKCGYRFFYVDSSDSPSELSWCRLVNTSRKEAQVVSLNGQGKKPARNGTAAGGGGGGWFGLSKHKTRLLADGLRLFPDSFHSAAFAPYNSALRPPWLCLTLLLPDRSLDLVSLSEQQAEEWFFGLQALVPLNPSFKSKPLYRWNRLRLKVQHQAATTGEPVEKVCQCMLQKAREAVSRERNERDKSERARLQQQRQKQQLPMPPVD